MAKLSKRAIRRNTVVRHKDNVFYGRVIRVLPDGNIFWLCCGLHFYIDHPENLETGYKGYLKQFWHSGKNESVEKFVHMTTLRRLKKQATRYHYENAHNTPLNYTCIQRRTS